MLCHTQSKVERFYQEAEVVLQDTNAKIEEAKALMAALRNEELLTPDPFDEPIEFIYFGLWHYYGRTAKHGASWAAQISCSGTGITNCC